MLMVRDKAFYRLLLRLALPLALQNVITYSVGLADNIMVGRLGELALSGAYVSNQLQNLLHMLVMGLSAAMLVLGTQFWGKRDIAGVKSVVAIALKFGFAAGLLLFIVTLLTPSGVLGLFTDDAAVKTEAMRYFSVIRYTYIFFCVTQVLIASMRCVETVRIGMVLSLMTFAVNVSLNYILIFGKLGAPALGLRGAAIATLAARVLEAVIMMVYVRLVDKKLMLRLRDILRGGRDLLGRFFRYGFPGILGVIFWGSNLAVLGAIMGVAVDGTAGATAIIVGKTVGAGDITRLRAYVKTLQVIFVIIGVISGVAIYMTRYLVPLIYDLEPETLAMVRSFILVLSVMVVGTAYQMSSLTGIVRAGGATHFVLVNDLIHIWGFVIPAASLAAFVFHASPVVVFALLKSDQLLKCIVAAIKVNRFRWVRNLTEDKQQPVKVAAG